MNNGTRCRLPGPNQDSSLGNGEEEIDAEEKLTVVTNRRLGYSYRAETSDCRCPCPSPSYEGHWSEEDRLFPLKKRRAIFASEVSAGTAADKEQESVKLEPTRVVTEKSQRTWVKRFDYPENEEDQQENNEAKKKLSRGREGKTQVVNSRCSRNSGRGWRCNRPAVQGHARCEYHLSRADHNRNWRTRHKNNISLKKAYPSLYSVEDEDNGKGFDKRSVGKARSISSLLDQTAPIPTSTSGR